MSIEIEISTVENEEQSQVDFLFDLNLKFQKSFFIFGCVKNNKIPLEKSSFPTLSYQNC